jgi:membrane-bound serine protease (ClpP class)
MARKPVIIGMIGLVFFLAAVAVQADPKPIYTVTIADTIGPGVAEFLEDALDKASQNQAACIIIALDTPGGAVASMRRIVQAIYTCTAPVVVYVSPSGARAASAGVMITMAADIAVMAPGTNIGAAHPVSLGGSDMGETIAEKAINDLVAFSKGIAVRRGRNAAWVEKAIRDSVSITAREALTLNVIDLMATDTEDLIQQINGRAVSQKGALDLDTALKTPIEQGIRTKILKTISDPNIAYILLLIGLAGLYFELSHPGAIFPGVVGGICLILAFYALQHLPVNTTGILLILLAIVLFIMEMKITSYGLLSVAGVITLVLGTLMLFKGAGPQYRIAWSVIVPTVALISLFFISVAWLVVRAQVHRPMTGADGLVGETGVVKQVDGLAGKVVVHGELWRAEFVRPVSVGDKIIVKEVDQLVVKVGPANSIPA